MPPLLVLGTRNKKKAQEIKEIFADLNLELRDLSQYSDASIIEEDGKSFKENAAKKATVLAKELGAYVLGEDSGLVVPGLNGRPGIYSARYAGKEGDDEANNDKLLAELAPLPDEKREAFYVCTAVVSDPQGEVKIAVEGRCHGRIIKERRGTGGFGYDPLFLIPEFHKTFGELSSRVKHAISHRCRALEKLRPELRKLFAI